VLKVCGLIDECCMKWSKSIYSYGMAVCLLEIAGEDVEMQKEAAALMGKVPELRQKIAGKSIPLEVRLITTILLS
jgi:Protein of unknown function (DUF3808)